MENITVQIPVGYKLIIPVLGGLVGGMLYLMGVIVRLYLDERKNKFQQIRDEIRQLINGHDECEKNCERKREYCFNNFIKGKK